MKLIGEINKSTSLYERKVHRMSKQIALWIAEAKQENRLGLLPIDVIMESNDDQSQQHNTSPLARRIHIIYDPNTGQIEKVTKTSILSRPPSEYTEANASQMQHVMGELERISPKMADALVNGDVNVWVPRNITTSHNGNTGSFRQIGLRTAPIIQTRFSR